MTDKLRQEPCAVVKWQTGGPVVHIIGEVQVGDLLYRAAPTPWAGGVGPQAVRDGIDAAVDFLESGDNYDVNRKSMAAALRCSGLIVDLLGRSATPTAQQDAQACLQVSAMTDQADAHLRALLRYTEGFYGTAIEHGMKAGPTANAVAHVERAGRALHEIIHAQAAMIAATTPPAQ